MQEAAEYLGLPVGRVEAALSYYASYPSEVKDIAARESAVAERAEAAGERARSFLLRLVMDELYAQSDRFRTA